MKEIRKAVESSGKYKILKAVDGGMNAYAYKARHIHLSRDVFLKVYDYVDSDSTLFQEPQYLMATTVSDSSSSYIIKIYDADIVGEYVLISTEFVDGMSLLDTITNFNLGLMDSIEITKKILMGLSHLHSKNLLHRDLKPANIMILEGQNGGVPKISDFGSAKKVENASDFVTASRNSALYVPAEGWENNQYGVVSDIYQVGLILFEMINGCLPYNDTAYLDAAGKSELKKKSCNSLDELDPVDRSILINQCISRRARSSKILALKPYSPLCVARIKRVIKKATHHSISERYGSISSFLGALSELDYPNWKYDNCSYCAHEWKGFDWKLELQKNSWCVKRARSGSGQSNYRQWKTGTLSELLKEVASL